MRSFGPCRSAISAIGRPSSACDRANEPCPLAVLVVGSVREVEPRAVHARLDELLQDLRRAGGRPDRGHDLRASGHGCHCVVRLARSPAGHGNERNASIQRRALTKPVSDPGSCQAGGVTNVCRFGARTGPRRSAPTLTTWLGVPGSSWTASTTSPARRATRASSSWTTSTARSSSTPSPRSATATSLGWSPYTLMGNHYHLIVSIPDARLSSALQRLHTWYSRRHNKRRHARGAPLPSALLRPPGDE